MSLEDRIQTLRNRIDAACDRARRDPATVELLPVSKHQPLGLLRLAAERGFTRFGENYVQEGAEKALSAPNLDLLLIGPLQRNKARLALITFTEILTVDRLDLLERLQRIAAEEKLIRPIWLQVDLWEERTKAGGCPASSLSALLAAARQSPALPLQGFMCIPPPDHTAAFLQMAELRAHWQDRLGVPLKLSMGMSSDLETAIGAGSDQIRIGTAFFGNRAD